MTTATQHAPDLSALTPTERLNIRVAQTQGYDWRNGEVDGLFAFAYEDGREVAHAEFYGGRYILHVDPEFFPNYAGDPSAWGALMDKEGLSLVRRSDGAWCAIDLEGCFEINPGSDPGSITIYGRRWTTYLGIGFTVCVGVLAKHGVDPTPYIGD